MPIFNLKVFLSIQPANNCPVHADTFTFQFCAWVLGCITIKAYPSVPFVSGRYLTIFPCKKVKPLTCKLLYNGTLLVTLATVLYT